MYIYIYIPPPPGPHIECKSVETLMQDLKIFLLAKGLKIKYLLEISYTSYYVVAIKKLYIFSLLFYMNMLCLMVSLEQAEYIFLS